MRDEIAQAASILESGGLVAFPTETVYGLGADAENPSALAKIFQLKRRPANHPLIVHLSPEADIGYWAHTIPSAAQRLTASFWPGPLTVILPRSSRIPSEVSGGQDTIGLRCPAHPVAIELLRAFKHGKGGIAAPSANKFGHVSPTTASHVCQEFVQELGGLLASVLDGGPSEVGIESTIIDISRMETHGPVLLRPGFISVTQLEAVLGEKLQNADIDSPRVSGSLASHYAPHTPLILQTPELLAQSAARLQLAGLPFSLLLHSMDEPFGACAVRRLSCIPDVYAHGLYAALRELDTKGSAVILAESPPDGDAWHGINDRLRRAAHGSASALDQLLTL